ncbi:MAG: hypothetical protein ABIJ91_00275 [Candidatus Kuenenbacteria bacterium]
MHLRKLTIFYLSAIFFCLFLAVGVNAEASDNLIVIFNPNPLFGEANFAPGQSAVGFVEIKNKSGQEKLIAAQCANVDDPQAMGDVLNLEINENSQNLFDDNLTSFFNAGQIFLSSLSNNASTTYEFIIGLNPDIGSEFQGMALNNFDISIGFFGEEDASVQSSSSNGGGTGGGGYYLRKILEPLLGNFDGTAGELKLPAKELDNGEDSSVGSGFFPKSPGMEMMEGDMDPEEIKKIEEVKGAQSINELQKNNTLVESDFFEDSLNQTDKENFNTPDGIKGAVAGVAVKSYYQQVLRYVLLIFVLACYLLTVGLYYKSWRAKRFKYWMYFLIILSGAAVLLIVWLMESF